MSEFSFDKKVLDNGYVRYVGHMGTDETIVEAARMSTGRGFVSWDPYYRCKTCDAAWIKHAPASPSWLNYEGVGEKPHPLSQPTWSLVSGFEAGKCCDVAPMLEENFTYFRRGDFGMLEHLYSNSHTTPFEMCELAIEVQAPIFVFREWHRHRTQSYNEFSARYSQMPNVHYVPGVNRLKKQSKTNKQGTGDEMLPAMVQAHIQDTLSKQQGHVYATYESWLHLGLSKEVARVNTPVSRYSKMRAKTDLLNWLKFLNLRMRESAQWEIREYANAVAEIVKQLWPKTYSLFEEWDLHAVKLSRAEVVEVLKMLKNDPCVNEHRFMGSDEGKKALIKLGWDATGSKE